jgi:hypothetical protein
MRAAILISTRLAVTLRFLATGDSYLTLVYIFRISVPAISTIIPEVCQVVIHSFIQYYTLRQAQSLLQNGSSTQCDQELPPSNESILSFPYPFKRRIKSHLPFSGIIRSSPYSPR